MDQSDPPAIDALIAALPETAGSALYGMVDVLAATGTLWRQLVGDHPGASLIRPRIVGVSREPFRCGNGIPVAPDLSIDEDPAADIVILPELWLAPDDDMKGRYPELLEWIRRRHRAGSTIYSACSGAVLLAATASWTGARRRRTGATRTCSAADFLTCASAPSRTWCSRIAPAGS